MKKALIIAFCGVVLALIIGATTQSKTSEPPKAFDVWLRKNCSEPGVRPKEKHPECAYLRDTMGDKMSELFLRKIKRKARRAYA